MKSLISLMKKIKDMKVQSLLCKCQPSAPKPGFRGGINHQSVFFSDVILFRSSPRLEMHVAWYRGSGATCRTVRAGKRCRHLPLFYQMKQWPNARKWEREIPHPHGRCWEMLADARPLWIRADFSPCLLKRVQNNSSGNCLCVGEEKGTMGNFLDLHLLVVCCKCIWNERKGLSQSKCTSSFSFFPFSCQLHSSLPTKTNKTNKKTNLWLLAPTCTYFSVLPADV